MLKIMEGFFSSMTNNLNNHHHTNPATVGHGGPTNNGSTANNQRISNEKQFKCDFCDKTFTQRRNQRAHIRTVHEKLKPFQCTHCGLTANRKFNLLSHIKKMHGTTEGTSVVDTRLSGGNSAAPAPGLSINFQDTTLTSECLSSASVVSQ